VDKLRNAQRVVLFGIICDTSTTTEQKVDRLAALMKEGCDGCARLNNLQEMETPDIACSVQKCLECRRNVAMHPDHYTPTEPKE